MSRQYELHSMLVKLRPLIEEFEERHSSRTSRLTSAGLYFPVPSRLLMTPNIQCRECANLSLSIDDTLLADTVTKAMSGSRIDTGIG